MSTVYAQRSSAVRAAKKAAGPDQEWVITAVAEGFTFSVLEVEEKQPAAPIVLAEVDHFASNKRIAKLLASGEIKVNVAKECKAATVLAETGATEAEHVEHRQEIIKPFQLAKKIVSECVSQGITSRKEIIAACLARGIKLNTADGAHYELCVRKS